jgi:hypothetical protein
MPSSGVLRLHSALEGSGTALEAAVLSDVSPSVKPSNIF